MTMAQAAKFAFDYMRKKCPYDTGNMHNTMSFEQVGRNHYRIRINPNDSAPYAVYTNEKWISPKWNGAHNPNYKWIDEGVQAVVKDLAFLFNGELTSVVGEKERMENKNYVAIADGG